MANQSNGKHLPKLPVGIQSFEKIRSGGYVYADKTEYIYNLIEGGTYYFLSRPRRFGKSLLVDTMKELFEGHRGLFSGLWIDKSDYDFKEYPVIRLDMTQSDVSSPEKLRNGIVTQLRSIASGYGLVLRDDGPVDALKLLIDDLKGKYKNNAVVLVDEYDKPVIDHIGKPQLAAANREVLGGVYGVLKGQDANLKFVFITGVTKYTKMSIFSKLNNLTDITLDRRHAGICGFTEQEFDLVFSERIDGYKREQKELGFPDGDKSVKEIREDIFKWYDGYTWDGLTRVFNPFSLLQFFAQGAYAYYWYSSGMPAFLYKVFKERPVTYADIQDGEMLEIDLETHETEDAPVKSLLFQTGFLTVKSVVFDQPMRYVIGLPNLEVSQSMSQQFIESVTGESSASDNAFISQIRRALAEADAKTIEECMAGLYASIPYQLHLANEAYYQTVFLSAMQFLGFKTSPEASVARGRIDGTLDMVNGNSYVIEFKYEKTDDGTPPEEIGKLLEAGIAKAKRQMELRGYTDKYSGSRRRVYKLAVCVAGRGNTMAEISEVAAHGTRLS